MPVAVISFHIVGNIYSPYATGDCPGRRGRRRKSENLPESERPYERFQILGAEALSDAELLAIILKTGTKDYTALDLARDLLSECQGNLLNLYEIGYEQLLERRGIGPVKAKPTAISSIPVTAVMTIALPIHLWLVSLSPLPSERLKSAALPSPIKSASASATTVNGYTTLVAAFPRYPTLCPIKIWSTILYRALTSIESTQGMENLSSNLPIGCCAR